MSSERAKSNSASRESRRLGPLEEDEIPVLTHRRQCDEIQFVPEPVEFTALPVVENEIAQRPVVAEIALHEVEAGRERPALAGRVRLEVRRRGRQRRKRRERPHRSVPGRAHPPLVIVVGRLAGNSFTNPASAPLSWSAILRKSAKTSPE